MAKTRVMLELSRSWLAERMQFGAGMPGAERKPSLAERMPAYVRRATVDCALSAGWVCIATLATVDPVRWRTICYALGFTEKQGQYLAFIYTCSHAPRPRPICNAISASARPGSIRWSCRSKEMA
jgi:hypothetical protein